MNNELPTMCSLQSVPTTSDNDIHLSPMLCDSDDCVEEKTNADPDQTSSRKRMRTEELCEPIERHANGYVLAAYLSIPGLESILNAYSSVTEYFGWALMTHLLFYGLVMDQSFTVSYAQRAEIWLPLLDLIRTRFKFLKVCFTLSPLFMYGGLSNALVSDTFWTSLAKTLKELRADGVLLNIESNTTLPPDFMQRLCKLRESVSVWVVISNRSNVYNESFFINLEASVDVVIVNSFGFMQTFQTDGEKVLLGTCESAIADFEDIAPKDLELLRPKLCMGIDTCGIRFTLDSTDCVTNVSILSLNEIERLKVVGVKIENKVYKFKEKFDDVRKGSLLHLGTNQRISYDSYRVRNLKMNKVVKEKFRGVVLGDIVYDMHALHPRSLLQVAFRKLATLGADNRPNCLGQPSHDLPC